MDGEGRTIAKATLTRDGRTFLIQTWPNNISNGRNILRLINSESEILDCYFCNEPFLEEIVWGARNFSNYNITKGFNAVFCNDCYRKIKTMLLIMGRD